MGDLCKSSLIFFSDQLLCYADILPPPQVRARIEVAVLNFIKILNSSTPEISDFSLINRRSSNSRVSRSLLTDASWIFLSHSFCTRSLMRANTAQAFVRDVVALLRCSRFSLGIMASDRGAIAGRLFLQEPGQEVVDCSTCGSSGYAISGDLNLLEKLVMKTDAHYIIVVEKHAIFQRLAEDCVYNQIPSILITAKGYPDIATRNPAGLAILCTFKYGSVGMGLEAYRYACNVKWLGLRKDDLELIPEQSFIPLKPRDLQIAKSLVSSEILQDNYKEELAVMVQSGKRAEIEALYFHGYNFLVKYIAKKIVQANYI
ncbi:sporulation 11-2 [Actinidia rufa]|uniref:Sporulation 11-2 n=1 Tax=Actinidia rufa TaxID=165716 RepID=A0A7J0FRJ4_9ERIC|nr:sporulation 11-2 [Actinidia rufa]